MTLSGDDGLLGVLETRLPDDPAAYVNGDFQTVGQNLDGACQ